MSSGLALSAWVAGGSALGGLLRYWAMALTARWAGEAFPWGTLAVNAAGSFLIGLLAGAAFADGRPLLHPVARQFLTVGVLGGFTTFSAFSLETLTLLQHGAWGRAGANAVASFALCLGGAWVGHAVGALGR